MVTMIAVLIPSVMAGSVLRACCLGKFQRWADRPDVLLRWGDDKLDIAEWVVQETGSIVGAGLVIGGLWALGWWAPP